MKIELTLAESEPLIREVVEGGGEFRLFPKGTSMLPLIRQGKDSVVLVKPFDKLKKRDIIFYRRDDGQFVLHRIVGVARDGSYILCGDNQTFFERYIRRDNILASVCAVYRDDKRLEAKSLRMRAYSAFWCVMPFRKLVFLAKRSVIKIKGMLKGCK